MLALLSNCAELGTALIVIRKKISGHCALEFGLTVVSPQSLCWPRGRGTYNMI